MSDPAPRNGVRVSGSLVVGAIVALIAIGVGAVVGLQLIATGNPAAGNHVGTIVALIGPTIVALLALLRLEDNSRKVDRLAEQTDGALKETIDAAVKVAVMQDRRRYGRPARRERDDPSGVTD